MYSISVSGEPFRDYPVAGSNEDAAKQHAEYRKSQGLEPAGLYNVIYSLDDKIMESVRVEATVFEEIICEELDDAT